MKTVKMIQINIQRRLKTIMYKKDHRFTRLNLSVKKKKKKNTNTNTNTNTKTKQQPWDKMEINQLLWWQGNQLTSTQKKKKKKAEPRGEN